MGGVVQLLDRAGTDLGKFDVTIGDFEYTLKARGTNVYRFEVSQRNSAIIRMACDGAVGIEFRIWGVNDLELFAYAKHLKAPVFTCSRWQETFEWAKRHPDVEVRPWPPTIMV